MIIVKYTGGLGNQMFQYALNIVLKNYFPQEEIYADLLRYNMRDEHEGFVLNKYFNINLQIVDSHILKRLACIEYFLAKIPVRYLKNRIPLRRLEKLDEWLEKKNRRVGIIKDYASTIYNHDAFNLNNEFVDLWHYRGNWVNPLYWKGYEEFIVKSFIFKEELLSKEDLMLIKEFEKSESVAVHIRQGDYVGTYVYDMCKIQYYEQAINKMLDIVENKKIVLYIFSEIKDINIDFIEGIEYKIISHPDQSGIDLWLMSKCKHNIICNSTFSYWSALLNQNKNKVVIAPLYGFRRKEIYSKLPVPNNWIQINNLEKGKNLYD